MSTCLRVLPPHSGRARRFGGERSEGRARGGMDRVPSMLCRSPTHVFARRPILVQRRTARLVPVQSTWFATPLRMHRRRHLLRSHLSRSRSATSVSCWRSWRSNWAGGSRS